MKTWVCLLIILFAIVIISLSLKIFLLRKSAMEICESIHNKIKTETNTLIDISSHDKCMCALANTMNFQLEELDKQRRFFQQCNNELKEAHTSMTHDLRTPLTAVCAYLDLLRYEEKSELVSKYLDRIQNCTITLKHISDELFCYTIAASDTVRIIMERVNVNSVLEDSISSYYSIIKKNHIVPHIEIPEQNVMCMLDKNALSRVFENLLSNAVKYSDGDLNVTLLESGKIIFSNHASSLTDTQVARLFDRFYTVNTARQSTGLGLSISKVLIAQMNGTISASYKHNVLTICIDFSASVCSHLNSGSQVSR